MAVDEVAQPDPGTARDAGQLVQRLNELRLWAGQPSLRTLRRLAGTTTAPSGAVIDALPTSTTSYLLNGRGLPRLPRLELIEAFVTACLRARDQPERRLQSEIDQWRVAWHRIAGSAGRNGDAGPAVADAAAGTVAADPPPGYAVPQPAVLDAGVVTTAAPAPASVGHPDPPRRGMPGHRRARWRRPGWPVTVALAAGAAGLALTGALLVTSGRGEPAAPGDALPPVPPATELRRGTVPAMLDTEGIDLDSGEVAAQDAEGIDLTPWALGNHVTTKSGALMELLEQPGEASYERCARVPARDLTDQVRGLYDVEAGAALCVWTRQGRVAVLTLTETPSQQRGVLSFEYVVWQPESAPTPPPE